MFENAYAVGATESSNDTEVFYIGLRLPKKASKVNTTGIWIAVKGSKLGLKDNQTGNIHYVDCGIDFTKERMFYIEDNMTTEPTEEPEPTEVPTPRPTMLPLTQDQIDVPFSDTLVGVDELYSQTFDDESWNEDYEIMDGMLFAPFQNGAYFKSWSALTLPFDFDRVLIMSNK